MIRLATGGPTVDTRTVLAPLAARHVPTRVVELLPRRVRPGDVAVLLELLDDDEITS